ncbi:MAG: hypothetical protein IKQ90_09250 [Ruminococcus sp.]|nr:hypothetical protein [Ruminococcus sp.]
MKVTIPEITDTELTDLLKSSGMTEDEAKLFMKRCESKCCCAEKVRILRKTRTSLLDTIHEKQTLLDKLDFLIWNLEHSENGGAL